ncbi:hypothetical protein ABT361_18115, partial [Nonomuraea wenchangensis]
MNDAAVRLGYLADTVRLLYPGPGSPRAYTVLPHARPDENTLFACHRDPPVSPQGIFRAGGNHET